MPRSFAERLANPICSTEGCSDPYWARDMCKRHYGAWQVKRYRQGNPDFVERQRERARTTMARKRLLEPEFRRQQVRRCKEWRNELKAEVYAAYGGACCACCGESEPNFLQLDHIDGDGCKHRKALGGPSASGIRTYQDLKQRGFPPGFQILCANCNFGRHRNGGTCPHKTNAKLTAAKSA